MGENKACKLTIPYFKEMMLISFNCQHCGVKTNEIKSGGEITEFGRIIELKVEGVEDIKRDVFKSDTASLKIPELELELAEGTLGGRFTSVEGILEKMLENLRDNVK